MIGLLQRVSCASVSIENERIATIATGLLVFVAVESHDQKTHADRLLERILNYRVFVDSTGRMNRSLREIQGGLLLVPQFTLLADTHKGMRPSFSNVADAKFSANLFNYLQEKARQDYDSVAAGVFGADMQVSLVNDGPATFWLQSK